MRTTIDLPGDLHQATMLLARDRGQTLSRTVAQLLRLALTAEHHEPVVQIDPGSGLPVVHLGRRVTAQDVAEAQDED